MLRKGLKNFVIKTARLIFDIVVVLFIVFFAYVFFATYTGRIPNIFGYHFFRVVSSSMEPSIIDGDCIISKTTPIDEIKVGDIITFYSEDPAIYNFLNTHRVVGIFENEYGEKEFITKGDSNAGEDVYTAKSNKIVGVYQGDIFIGEVISKGFEILSNRVVYFIFIMLPIIMCFISSIVDIIHIVMDDDDDTNDETIEVCEFEENEFIVEDNKEEKNEEVMEVEKSEETDEKSENE